MKKNKKAVADVADLLTPAPQESRAINGENDLQKIHEKIEQYKHLVRCARVGYYTIICHPGGEEEFTLRGMPQHLHGQITDVLMDAAGDIRNELLTTWNVRVVAADI